MESQEVVLITGCSSGIGLATAVYLAENGYKVYASMRDLEKKNRLLAAADKAGVSVNVIQLDVTDEESTKNAVSSIAKEEGRIDVLVNNAGYGSGGFLEDFSMDEIREQFETNFFGLVAVTKEVLPIMRGQKKGCIVNITSLGGRIAFPVISVYNASKFAVEALTESLRVELAPFEIKVTAVEPGSVKTNFSSSVKAAKMSRNPSSPYHGLFERFEKNIARLSGNNNEPITVARRIYEAITSRRPKRSYFVAGARMFWVLKLLLPNRVFERMMGRLFLG